jgi:hypothetical protein
MLHYLFDFPLNDIYFVIYFVEIIFTFYIKSVIGFKYPVLSVKGELQMHETYYIFTDESEPALLTLLDVSDTF